MKRRVLHPGRIRGLHDSGYCFYSQGFIGDESQERVGGVSAKVDKEIFLLCHLIRHAKQTEDKAAPITN